MRISKFSRFSTQKIPVPPFKQKYHDLGVLGYGKCLDGAYHEHDCPDCGKVTSGTGASRCPVCANKFFVANG